MTDRPMTRWRPETMHDCILSHVIRRNKKGEPNPAGEDLLAFARNPHNDCKLFLGPPGTGKSAAMRCLIQDVWDGGFPTPDCDNSSELGIDKVQERYRYLKCMLGCNGRVHFHIWAVDELAKMSREAVEFLKSALDPEVGLPPHAIIIATSNDVSGLQGSFLQRFDKLEFPDSREFRDACLARARAIWHAELEQAYGVECPNNEGLKELASEQGDEFSFRSLLRSIEARVMRHEFNATPRDVRNARAEAECKF